MFNVTITPSSIKFVGEQATIDFGFPEDFSKDSAIWEKIDAGFDMDKVNACTLSELSIVRALFEKSLLVSLNEDPKFSIIDRNLGHFLSFSSTPHRQLEMLQNSCVCILGIGGIGSVLLQHLVASGIYKYILLDHDVVESSNLNRQLIYTPADIGQRKVDMAANFVKLRLRESIIESHHLCVDSLESLLCMGISNCHFIANCLDTPRGEIDEIVHEFGEIRNIPVMGAGVGVIYGHWGPLLSAQGGVTFNDWKKSTLRTQSSDLPNKPMHWSFGPTNTIISAHMALDIINWLSGNQKVLSFNRRVILKFEDNETIFSKSIDAIGN